MKYVIILPGNKELVFTSVDALVEYIKKDAKTKAKSDTEVFYVDLHTSDDL